MEIVHFFKQGTRNPEAEELFEKEYRRIKDLLPFAEIEHIGSTAIPGSLTKGDLDIQVRVPSSEFSEAVAELSKIYDLNEGSAKTEDFRAFEKDGRHPALGVQLTVKESTYDFFTIFRDILLAHESERLAYDELKEAYHGRSMADYREAKNNFIEKTMKKYETLS